MTPPETIVDVQQIHGSLLVFTSHGRVFTPIWEQTGELGGPQQVNMVGWTCLPGIPLRPGAEGNCFVTYREAP